MIKWQKIDKNTPIIVKLNNVAKAINVITVEYTNNLKKDLEKLHKMMSDK